MQFVKGEPYFCQGVNKIKRYPYLTKNITCDILVIGGDICGAVANYFLSQKYNTILVESNRLGHSCTSCATALLEYQLDDFAYDLKDNLSEEMIRQVYFAGLNAISKLDAFTKKYGNHCQFAKKDTLVYSNKTKDISALKREYEFRKNAKLDVKYIDKTNNPFPFDIQCGLYCKNGGAECNPYLLEKQFIENASNQSNIYENTTIVDITRQEQYLIARTTYGETIKAKNIVLATGFDYTLVNNNIVCDKFVTSTIVTKPIKNLEWYNNALIQDYLDPYHYMRILPDNRIIYGGEDFDCPNDNIDEKKVQKKYVKLEKDLKNMLNKFCDKIVIDSCFCGVFGSTENNLGYIGYSGTKGVYYFYSCGANGIINTMFGIDVLLDSLENKSNKFTKIFSPLREK